MTPISALRYKIGKCDSILFHPYFSNISAETFRFRLAPALPPSPCCCCCCCAAFPVSLGELRRWAKNKKYGVQESGGGRGRACSSGWCTGQVSWTRKVYPTGRGRRLRYVAKFLTMCGRLDSKYFVHVTHFFIRKENKKIARRWLSINTAVCVRARANLDDFDPRPLRRFPRKHPRAVGRVSHVQCTRRASCTYQTKVVHYSKVCPCELIPCRKRNTRLTSASPPHAAGLLFPLSRATPFLILYGQPERESETPVRTAWSSKLALVGVNNPRPLFVSTPIYRTSVCSYHTIQHRISTVLPFPPCPLECGSRRTPSGPAGV